MTVAAEVEAEIARLFHAEHWKVGTIVAQLGVHEDVVRRVLGLLRPPAERAPRPPLLVAPFTNVYSVPPDHVERTLILVADDLSVRLLDGANVVAHHPRSWGHRRLIKPDPSTARPAQLAMGAPPGGRD